MAIPHFSVKGGSRADARSAAQHYRYLLREGQYQKMAHELAYVRHGNYPVWAQEQPLVFWKAADLYERANARLYTELEVALPRELSRAEQIALVNSFLDEHLGQRHPYTAVIHHARALDDQKNPHAHILFSERCLDEHPREKATFFSRANPQHPERGGAKKDRGWNKREKVGELRMSWEVQANQALERSGSRARVDMRSLRAQGIERKPEPKLGPGRTALYRKGIVTEAAQEVMQLRVIASKEKERAQVRTALGRAKIAQYQEKQKHQSVVLSAGEVLSFVQRAKEQLYESLERSEQQQYAFGGRKPWSGHAIQFDQTRDPFVRERRAALVKRHAGYEEELSALKSYERELLLIPRTMSLAVTPKGDWSKRSSLVHAQEFQQAVEQGREQQQDQSLQQERERHRSLHQAPSSVAPLRDREREE